MVAACCCAPLLPLYFGLLSSLRTPHARPPQPSTAPRPKLREVLPSQGAVFVERSLSEVLCKPKILGIKSVALEKVEAIEKEGAALAAKARASTARG